MSYVVKLCERNQSTGDVDRTTVTSYVINGFSFIDKLDDTLDIGQITLRGITTSTPYDMFSWIEVYDDTTLLYSQRIAGDSVRLISKNPLRYEHTLSLVEHTKILERFLISGKTFTQPTDGTVRYTLYSVLDKLIDTTPLETEDLVDTTRICVLPTSGDLYTILITNPSPEYTFKEITLREGFKQVGDYINGIPRLFINDDDELELTFDFVNELKTLITSENDFIEKSVQQDITLHGTQLESETINIVADTSYGESVEIFPSENSFISLRKDTFLQDGYDDNAYIPTPKRIYDVQKVVCRAKISVINSSTSDTYYNGYTDIRITDRIVEKKLYDTLEFDGSTASTPYKTTTIYYEYLGKKIQHGITYGVWSVTDVISNVLEWSIYQQGIEDSVIPDTVDISLISFSLVSPTTIDDLLFQVHYIPVPQSTRINIDKENLTDVEYNSALLSNQQARLINLENFANNMAGRINRIGNSELQLEHRVTSFDDLNEVGDYTSDTYIVTERETIFHKDYIYAKYNLTRDFNKISDFIGVNSEVRQWEIGENNTLDRNLIYKEYLEIEAVSSGTGSNSSNLIRDDFTDAVIETFKTSSSIPPVRGGIANGTDFDDPVFLSMSSNGAGNSFIFSGKFPDNKIAGFTRETVSGQTAKNYIPYTDEDGLSQDLELYLFDEVDDPATEADRLTNADNYPKTTLTAPKNTYLSTGTLYEFMMYKDSREIIGITYMLQMISSDEVILGRWLALRNRLVSENPPTDIKLYYSNTDTLSRIDTLKLDDTNYTEITTPTIITDATNYKLTVTGSGLTSSAKSWVLTDENDMILLGVNQDGTLLNTITFDFKNKRTGIKYKY